MLGGIKSNMKQSLKNWFQTLASAGNYYLGLHRFWLKREVIILMYHRVLQDDDPVIEYIQPGMYVTQSSFERHLEYLTEFYDVVPLSYLIDSQLSKQPRSSKGVCVLTFDDGWLDNYTNAFPVLRKFNLPATIFLTTSFIGTNKWFWSDLVSYLFYKVDRSQIIGWLKGNQTQFAKCLEEIEASSGQPTWLLVDKVIEDLKALASEDIYKGLESIYLELSLSIPGDRCFLNWEEVKDMSDQFVSFGSHTCNHRLLNQISEDLVSFEINESKEILERMDINYTPVFCYPNGNNNESVKKIVCNSGYKAALTTKFGSEKIHTCDLFGLKRIGVHEGVASSKAEFAFRLSGIKQALRKVF